VLFAGHGPNVIPLSGPPPAPLAIVLPRLLENIEAELENEKLKSAQKSSLCQRAELIRGLLAPRHLR
jgi:hypothetical protein